MIGRAQAPAFRATDKPVQGYLSPTRLYQKPLPSPSVKHSAPLARLAPHKQIPPVAAPSLPSVKPPHSL